MAVEPLANFGHPVQVEGWRVLRTWVHDRPIDPQGVSNHRVRGLPPNGVDRCRRHVECGLGIVFGRGMRIFCRRVDDGPDSASQAEGNRVVLQAGSEEPDANKTGFAPFTVPGMPGRDLGQQGHDRGPVHRPFFTDGLAQTPQQGHDVPYTQCQVRLGNENPAAIGNRVLSLHWRSPRGTHLPTGTGSRGSRRVRGGLASRGPLRPPKDSPASVGLEGGRRHAIRRW